jgi:hypothetical protein
MSRVGPTRTTMAGGPGLLWPADPEHDPYPKGGFQPGGRLKITPCVSMGHGAM